MINEYKAKRYCKDDISKIENYEKAISDDTQMWDLHHRLELTLEGEFALSRDQLKMHDMYYNRPYYELIFLTHVEHARLHNKGELNTMYGKTHTTEARKKISDAKKGCSAWNKGKTMNEEFSRKMSELKKGQVPWNKGKHGIYSEDTCRKISEARKGRIPWNKGKHNIYSEETCKKMSEAAKNRCKK